MKTLLTIIGIIAAIIFVALFFIIAAVKHEFSKELYDDDYLDDLYEGRKEH